MTTLPPTFVLHISTRHSAADPFSGYIMFNAARDTPSSPWTLTLASPEGPHTIHNGPMDTPLIAQVGRYNLQHMSAPNLVLRKTIHATTRTVRNAGGQSFPILIMSQHTGVLLPRLKRNFQIVPQQPVAPSVQAPLVHPVQAPPVPIHPTRHPTTTAATLPLFVARQLLELAQLKHEECPIIAEEFSTGNTAVMPCGHLFAQMAIEGSFATTPNMCPACRQPGSPAYV